MSVADAVAFAEGVRKICARIEALEAERDMLRARLDECGCESCTAASTSASAGWSMADVDFDAIAAANRALPDDEDTPERLRKRIATIDGEQAIRREHRDWLVRTLKRADQELAYWNVERQRLRARLPDGDDG